MKPSYQHKTSSGGWKGKKSSGGSGGAWTGGFRDKGDRAELHDAVCNKCGKPCKVPFKPNGSKPIFCRDCFRPNDDRGGASFDRPSFEEKRSFAPRSTSGDTSKLESRLVRIEEKLDALIDALTSDEDEDEDEKDGK